MVASLARPSLPGGVIFHATPGNRVFAINAVTGKELWHYYYQLPKTLGLIYGPVNRGVALGGLIFMGIGNPAADFYGGNREGLNLFTDCVVALNVDTGELIGCYQEIPHDGGSTLFVFALADATLRVGLPQGWVLS